jgi:hypothetical protein
MAEDMVFSMTVKTERKFFPWRWNGKGQMNIFLVLFGFFRMAARTVDIDVPFSEMKVRVGQSMAVHTEQMALMVDILVPFLRINEERANFAIARNLGHFRLAVTGKAFLVWV